ncbi:MAG: hypothetical protein AAGM46_28315, partial [Cyanobacteria bacterium J06582_2]
SETNETFEQEEEEIPNLYSSEHEDPETKENKPNYGARFEEGDLVWAFQPYKAESRKIYFPWKGPYTILRRTGEVHYQIRRPGALGTWRNIHYSLLKPYRGESYPSRGKRIKDKPPWNYEESPHASDSSDQETEDRPFHVYRPTSAETQAAKNKPPVFHEFPIG